MSAGGHPYLQPLRLTGGAVLPSRILPGPMEGITTGSFCAVLAAAGQVSCWVTPFLRVTTGLPRPARLRLHLSPYLSTGLPVVAQVMGLDLGLLGATAAGLVRAGAVGVDLNCACPSRTVVANGAGAARLRHPEWIAAALQALRQALPQAGLGIKLRSGLTDPAEMDDVLAAVAGAAPDFVTLHYRTAAEGYAPVEGGWERLARARTRLPGVVLIGCGDVDSTEAALRLHRQTGVDGVAAARGLLRRPWLLVDIAAACAGRPTAGADRRRALSSLRDMAVAAAAQRPGRTGFVLEVARQMLGDDDALFRELSRCQTLEQAARCLQAATAVAVP
ncbi:MAG: tRNA-dihydrouridine synthase family protein [Lentisphaerae bacterium]|nr:tRNA-dihydrouridine synthase family protein [Lentisphaerota bacterium]